MSSEGCSPCRALALAKANARVEEAFADLDQFFHVGIPKFAVGVEMPSKWLATTDPYAGEVHFRQENPSPGTIAHELGHVFHVKKGLACEREACENFAEKVEKWYLEGAETFQCSECGDWVPATDGYAICPTCLSMYEES